MSRHRVTLENFWLGVADQVEQSMRAPEGLPEGDWRAWLATMFPAAVSLPFGSHHAEFWDWVWAIEAGSRPPALIAIWPRGGGKSSSAELAVVALGARRRRKYGLIVSETQDQADGRVGNIAALLESTAVSAFYPSLGKRAVTKYGVSKGWRRNRLRTATGFVVDGLGLETASRGLKVDDQRPDFIILDDIDGRHDTEERGQRKLSVLTETVLPLGSSDLAVLGVQNLITPHGVFSRLSRGQVDLLVNRRVSGPVPAVRGLEIFRVPPGEEVPDDVARRCFTDDLAVKPGVRSLIVGGEATWAGQTLETCQALIDRTGHAAFMREQQHEVDFAEGALWRPEMIRRVARAPDNLAAVVVGVDPSGGAAEIGIIVAARDVDGRYYVLEDRTQPGPKGPMNWGRQAAECLWRHTADKIVAERNFGGDMVDATIQAAAGMPVPVEMVSASRGKTVRAAPVVTLYESGLVDHVGVFPKLERELTTWTGAGSPNRLDALVWALTALAFPAPSAFSGGAARPPGL